MRVTRFEFRVLAILHRILKSTCFNILMMIIGFLVGFGYMVFDTHFYAVANSNYEFVIKIEHVIKELKDLDEEYGEKQDHVLELLEEFKKKLAHDQHDNCLLKK